MRIGTNKRPFYRIVAVDERAKRTGAYLENLGTYNPLTNPHDIVLKQDRIDEWVKKGAQLSNGFLRIIGKAPQKPPRKPKKEKAAAPAAAPVAEKPVEAEAVEPTPDESANEAPEAVTAKEVVETPEEVIATPEEAIETPSEAVETPTEEATTEDKTEDK
jgi:small subunit ribosomal protein S16